MHELPLLLSNLILRKLRQEILQPLFMGSDDCLSHLATVLLWTFSLIDLSLITKMEHPKESAGTKSSIG